MELASFGTSDERHNLQEQIEEAFSRGKISNTLRLEYHSWRIKSNCLNHHGIGCICCIPKATWASVGLHEEELFNYSE